MAVMGGSSEGCSEDLASSPPAAEGRQGWGHVADSRVLVDS